MALVVGILVSCLTGQLPLVTVNDDVQKQPIIFIKSLLNDNIVLYLWQKYVCIHIYLLVYHIKNSLVCVHHTYIDFNDESKVIS